MIDQILGKYTEKKNKERSNALQNYPNDCRQLELKKQ